MLSGMAAPTTHRPDAAMISFDVTAFGQLLQRRVRATPQPQGSQVLLRTLAEGANHADLHIWHGWYDLGQGKRLEMDSGSVNLPLTLGHEIAGEVAAMGPDAFMCKAVGEVIDCVGAERMYRWRWACSPKAVNGCRGACLAAR